MRAMHRVGGRWPRQHQAHHEKNSYLHYLSPNCAHVKPKFSKIRLWVKCRSQTSGLTRSVFGHALEPFAQRLAGHQQVGDAYLLGLAMHKKGKLATMDRAIRA
jgi:hypothetical protein